jgi:hypothetical protein
MTSGNKCVCAAGIRRIMTLSYESRVERMVNYIA